MIFAMHEVFGVGHVKQDDLPGIVQMASRAFYQHVYARGLTLVEADVDMNWLYDKRKGWFLVMPLPVTGIQDHASATRIASELGAAISKDLATALGTRDVTCQSAAIVRTFELSMGEGSSQFEVWIDEVSDDGVCRAVGCRTRHVATFNMHFDFRQEKVPVRLCRAHGDAVVAWLRSLGLPES